MRDASNESTSRQETAPERVLYVTSRFPALSMTFVANEMTAVDAAGSEVSIAPIWPSLPGHDGHETERSLMRRAIRVDFRKPGSWLPLLAAIRRTPSVLTLVAKLVPGHLKSPWLLAKLVTSIPKGLFYGEWAARNQIDWIHAHFLTSPTTVAMIAAKVSGIPFSATAHAFDITSDDPKIMNGSVSLKCRKAATIITISDFNVRDILSRWPELASISLEVVYNGIDTDFFAPRAIAAPFDHDGTVRVLSISNLAEKKGFPFLIRAVAKLRDEGRDVRLDIYGEGPERAKLESILHELNQGDGIVLHGACSQKVVAEQCQKADIYALASVPLSSGDADGLPTVLIESLAVELPTVSTQVTGIPEIIRDHQTGLCVPPADVGALADAIGWMIDNPHEAREMGKAGRRLVLDSFDRTRAAEQLRTIWAARLGDLARKEGKG